MYLLDTPLLVDLGRARAGKADPGLVAWAGSVSRQTLFISALTLLELENGARRPGKADKAAAALRPWIDEQVMRAFEGRILPVDAAVVRRSAQLGYADARDGLLAATAIEHKLTLVTLQTAAFKTGRVKLFDPRGYSAEEEDDGGDWRQAARTGPSWLKNLFVRA